MTLVEFLLARIADDEATATGAQPAHWKADFVYVKPVDPDALPFSYVARLNGTVGEAWAEKRNATHIAQWDPARVLAECEAKRQIIEWHKNWPVLVEKAPSFEPALAADDLTSTTFRVSRQIAWLTEQEYRNRFGDEPPTGPILRMLAMPYADHPDYREEWRP